MLSFTLFLFVCLSDFTRASFKCYFPHFLQIQTWSMHTCIRRQAPTDRLHLLLVKALPIPVRRTPTTNPPPRRAIRSENTPSLFEQLSVINRIFKDNFLFGRTWSLRPSHCPPCPRPSLLMGWATWATSPIICRIWFQRCQARTLICPPSSPTCQASSPYTNRSVFPFLDFYYLSLINQTKFGWNRLCCKVAPPGGPQQQQQQQQLPPQQQPQAPQAVPSSAEAQLISFDWKLAWSLAVPTHYTSLLPRHLWDFDDPLREHDASPHVLPPSLWCCGNVKYCDDVAELLLYLLLPGWENDARQVHLPPAAPISSWCVCRFFLIKWTTASELNK